VLFEANFLVSLPSEKVGTPLPSLREKVHLDLASSPANLQEARRQREAGRALQGELPQEEPEPPEARAVGGWIESTSIFFFFSLCLSGGSKN
jgi:hypothetical protein